MSYRELILRYVRALDAASLAGGIADNKRAVLARAENDVVAFLPKGRYPVEAGGCVTTRVLVVKAGSVEVIPA